jgi:hypothetical protein
VGTLLTQGSSRPPISRQSTRQRWHEIATYVTPEGKYVAKVSYRTDWRDERDHHEVAVFFTPKNMAKFLSELDPTTYVIGYPDDDRYTEKQRRLLLNVEARYQELVSKVLDLPQFQEAV